MHAALALLMLAPVPTQLRDYLRLPTPEAGWTRAEAPLPSPAAKHELRLVSQKWQGITWKHDLAIVPPRTGEPGSQAILLITGNRGRNDIPIAQALADQARQEVAVLFNVPNQPLWNLNEDALIAHSFGRWLETKDDTWPLLFPMTKAGMKAMDAVQEWSKGRIKSFVVTGASKRGWTTWLVGASGDPRIKGISPLVIDILNMPVQLERQKRMFGGKLSEQIADYSETGLTELLSSSEGQKLTKMVDPYWSLPSVKAPVLVVVGGNDRYWTVDAHTVYWDKIKTPKLLKVVPNAGHNLGDGREALASIAFFARVLDGSIPGGLPKAVWKPGDLTRREPKGDKRFVGTRKWLAESASLDFRDSAWKAEAAASAQPKNRAEFLEYRFRFGTSEASFTSGVVVTEGRKASF
jgi:PhoPQ-activated pathogenicity-related protein